MQRKVTQTVWMVEGEISIILDNKITYFNCLREVTIEYTCLYGILLIRLSI